MSDKQVQISLDQLQEVVSTAVTTALRNIEHLQVVDDESKSSAESVKVGQFDNEQYEEAINVMAANRGHGEEPKVGIFWYNATIGELFGVVTHKRTDYLKPNAGGGLITCSEMHEDVWKKEFRKQKFHGNGIGPFKGEYQYKPRGRVFYSPAEDQYIIAVGSWIEEHKEAIDLVMEEFDLPKDKTVVKIAMHWDIGQTWN